MALNRPTGAELIAAVRAFLETEVAGQVTGATQFNLRIAGNVLAIVERELAQRAPADAAETARLVALLAPDAGPGDDLVSLNRHLSAAIRAGRFDAPAAQRTLRDHLRATTAAKLAIDNPRYR